MAPSRARPGAQADRELEARAADGRRYVARSEVPAGWMSRARLARAAGVSRATVKHYADIGLLPPPLLTSPNMGYYAPECVERIRLARRLQAERHLPLERIARMLAEQGPERVERALAVSRAIRADLLDALSGEEARPAGRSELLAVEGIDDVVLDELEQLELIRRLPGGGEPRYDPPSRGLVEAVGVLRAAGLSEASGFSLRDLALYREHLSALVAMELRLFSERWKPPPDSPDTERAVRSALRDSRALVLAVRDRLLADALSSGDPPQRTGSGSGSPPGPGELRPDAGRNRMRATGPRSAASTSAPTAPPRRR